ncbi:hypothetical protein CK500_00380 [Halorubrum salipaludis]|uniref:Uncharacterized protein n=1 Tax=Halorubrum salipaludis TaxID=2032630 RepID=A0A2A2FKS9_9EURY|nr:hypothetical protein [Halorubrum salipaludis]PAU85163.1 hypothetical protein CK500_00380 [Halorubrum salipaludis]
MKRRTLILLLGGGGSAALSTGTGAFSSATAERGVSMDVVEDKNAFVGYRSEDRTLPDDLNGDGTVDLVTVTNQFTQKIEFVDAVIDEGADYFAEPNVPEENFEPGDSATVTAEPTEYPDDGIKVAVTVKIKGTGVAAEVFGDTATRRFQITKTSTVVHYNGKGTINVEGQPENSDTIEVDVYSIPNGSPTKQEKQDSLASAETVKVEPNSNENLSGWVVAVEVGGDIYQHPGWNESTCSFHAPKQGPGVPVDSPPDCE